MSLYALAVMKDASRDVSVFAIELRGDHKLGYDKAWRANYISDLPVLGGGGINEGVEAGWMRGSRQGS